MIISDILEEYCGVMVVIMGDVTYGACCIDDYTAKSMNADLLVHYGHSCLLPITKTFHGISYHYVFVSISVDPMHFIETVKLNIDKKFKIAFISIIQFVKAIHYAKQKLCSESYNIILPQAKPLSPGEILGCTSPNIPNDVDIVMYMGDGRFHVESCLIANPHVKTYQYNPYDKKLTRERYNHKRMTTLRQMAIHECRKAKTIGIILGALGRQGSIDIVNTIRQEIINHGRQYIICVMSEVFPMKLSKFENIDAWVEIACPRLAIDWGYAFQKPLLSPYELMKCLNDPILTQHYPMDYYMSKVDKPWTNNSKPSI